MISFFTRVFSQSSHDKSKQVMSQATSTSLRNLLTKYNGALQTAQAHLVALYWLRTLDIQQNNIEEGIVAIIAKFVPWVSLFKNKKITLSPIQATPTHQKDPMGKTKMAKRWN